ncbi:MAG: endonuclease [Bacteroidetes bacterium]|nr:endonuclease [Bacteroidota bacterium]MBL7105106.1 endonuclease [Bacteroidales bacterium]
MKAGKLIYIFILSCSVFLFIEVKSQSELSSNKNRFRIVFYNVENLFDIYDDSLKMDEEFTPGGIKGWNNKKFYKKLNNISKIIMSIGEWDPPAVVGLCEVENRFVLNKLIYETPLKNIGYKIVHEESPDKRGIDVAFLYRPDKFEPLWHEAIGVYFPFDTSSKTRDILYVKGVIANTDTIHFFVNHWPSRYGGYLVTKPKREFVAGVLRTKVDSIFQTDIEAKILIMGDFNDDPDDESVLNVLNAKSDTAGLQNTDLFNLMFIYEKKWKSGTLKYLGKWNVFDQLIISEALFSGVSGLKISDEGAKIFNPDFLFEEDMKYLGIKPFRTYSGPKYQGGFSDHLPIYLDLIFN